MGHDIAVRALPTTITPIAGGAFYVRSGPAHLQENSAGLFAFAGAVMVAVVGQIYQADPGTPAVEDTVTRRTQSGIPSAVIIGAVLTVVMVGLIGILVEVAFVLPEASDIVSNGEEDEGDGDQL